MTENLIPEELRRRDMGPLFTKLAIVILQASPTCVRATMPVEGSTQPRGVLHGGASAMLAETVASIGGTLHAGDARYAVGVDLSITHHGSVREGLVTATATSLHLGRRLTSYDVAITTDTGRRIATSRVTCMVVDPSERTPNRKDANQWP